MLERLTGSMSAFIPVDLDGTVLSADKDAAADGYIRALFQQRRIFVGIEGDEPLLSLAAAELGHGTFLYSSDSPHEVTVESCREELAELVAHPELSNDAKRGICGGNAATFYRLG
jgi:predicted TIM-barrel fold metal-dependent hydrolase